MEMTKNEEELDSSPIPNDEKIERNKHLHL